MPVRSFTVDNAGRAPCAACEPLEGRRLLSGVIETPLFLSAVTISENFTVNQSVAGFSDSVPDPIASYRATIDWGDGTAVTAGSVSLEEGLYYVTGSHQYTKPGAFSVTATLADGPAGNAGTASATSVGGPLTVTPMNDAPIGRGESLGEILEDSGPHPFLIAGLLANDDAGPVGESDEDAQSLTVTAISNVVGGTAVIQGGNVVFTPSPEYVGIGQFTYTLVDNGTNGGTNGSTAAPLTATASADFRIRESNDAPIAVSDMVPSVAEDSPRRDIQVSTLLANDSAGPANEAGQRLRIIAVSNVVGGTINDFGGSEVRFTPAANFNGIASFTYTITDDGRTGLNDDPRSASASVFFLVTPVNDDPRAAQDDLTSITGSTPRTIPFSTLLGNDLAGGDEINQTLTVTGVSNVVGGTAVMSGNAVAFTATPGFDGTASFDYTVTDNGVTGGLADPRSATGTVRFEVIPLPTIVSSGYLFDAATPTISAVVSMNANVDLTAVTLFRDASGTASVVTPVSVAYDAASRTISVAYTGPGGVLPDGTYHLTITPNGVMNRRGEGLRTTFRYDFHVLAGDANRDRTVDFDDLLILAQNYGQSGRTFSRGDSDYDGTVDFDDLLILAQRYGTSLLVQQGSAVVPRPKVALNRPSTRSTFIANVSTGSRV